MRGSWVAAVLAALFVLAATPAQAQEKKVLKIGWEQDPQTLSPFTDQDEESYRIWAINYDLLVNFSPDDLSPSPGIAENWDISDDKKTITFHLYDGLKWSDGEPLTSEDVKYSFEVLGGNGLLFTSYTENVTSIETPDDTTVIVHTKKPDTRIVGGIFVWIIPKHIWGKQTVKQLTGSYRPTSRRSSAAARTSSPSSTPTGSCGWSATRTGAATGRRSTSSSGSSTAAPTPSSAR